MTYIELSLMGGRHLRLKDAHISVATSVSWEIENRVHIDLQDADAPVISVIITLLPPVDP